MTDGIHENYAGVQVLGTLRQIGYAQAALNTNPRKPFHALSFAAALANHYDFRTASRSDWSGNPNALWAVGTAFPLHSVDALVGDHVLPRVAASTTYRVDQIPNTLTASYPKSIWMRFDSFVASQGLLGDALGGAGCGTASKTIRAMATIDCFIPTRPALLI